MSPFSHFLHELRMRRSIRQAELADLLGYDQTYISALEVGLKGPPTPEFVAKLAQVFELSSAEVEELRIAADASQRKLVIDIDTPRDVYLLLHELRAKLPALGPTHVRLIKDVLTLSDRRFEAWPEPSRRVRRRSKEEVAM
jgi:transcriptional regulator with XRE-family HTH domain